MPIKKETKIRPDKAKKIKKVAEALIKNPLKSSREIAKETGVSKSSVSNYINNDLAELGQKDFRIIEVCNDDMEIVKLTQAETIRRLKDEEEIKKITMQDLNRAWDVSTKRYTLFKWDATDKNWWLNSTKDMTTEELLRLASE